MVITRGKGGWGEVEGCDRGINGGGRRLTWGGEHTIQCTGDVSQKCTPETYVISLTNVTLINSVRNKNTENLPQSEKFCCSGSCMTSYIEMLGDACTVLPDPAL